MVTGNALRIVFFGTPQFAVASFDALSRSRHAVSELNSMPSVVASIVAARSSA